jgi:hypothetical protein
MSLDINQKDLNGKYLGTKPREEQEDGKERGYFNQSTVDLHANKKI